MLRSDRLDKMINIKQDYFENYNIEKENSKDLKGQSSVFKFLPQKSRYDFSSNLQGQNPTNDLSMTSVGQNLRAIQDERTRQRYRAEVSGKRQYTNTLQGNLTNNIQSHIYSEEPETPEFPKSVLGSAEFLHFNHGQPKRRNESYLTQ